MSESQETLPRPRKSASDRRFSTRPLTTQDEFRDAVDLQRLIWGFEDVELLPVRLFVVATKVGGQAFGAFDGERMVGFCLAIPGLKSGGASYLHSHMLGVAPEYRDSGVGRMLKLHQRQEALARSIRLIEWTFDPLEIKNAYFNVERLGAVVRRYVLNQYGTTTSALHGGLPTDRCIAEWWLDSPRVNCIVDSMGTFNRPATLGRIAVPAQIGSIRQEDVRLAREIQQEVSTRFLEYFESGLAVVGFERSPTAGTYLLGNWESESPEKGA